MKFNYLTKLHLIPIPDIRRSILMLFTVMVCCCYSAESMASEIPDYVVKTIQQGHNLSGMVVDKENVPIIGAAVLVKGTTIGVVSDVNGKFSIDIPDDKNIITVSYIGYSTVDVNVDDKKDIVVTLFEQSINMQEVVVIGYNTVKRSSLTGAVDVVKSKNIANRMSASLEDRLQGKVSGLMIATGSGQPGTSDVKIRIRGTGSINGSNTPLYILDGVMIEPAQFASLNANDIRDIQVLKDASSTAIYGSRGSNGVIVITSKRGQDGHTQVSYNLKVGTSIMHSLKNRMMTGPENILYQTYCVQANPDSKDFPLMRLLGLEEKINKGTITSAELAEYNAGKDRLTDARNTDVDYIDLMTRNGLTMEHNVSLNGGNSKTQFFLSGSYLNQDGILKESNLERYSLRLNLDHKLNNNIKLGVRTNVGYADSKFADPAYDQLKYRISWQNPWFTSYLAYPYEDPDRWFNGDNPTLLTKYFHRKYGLLHLIGSAYLDAKITNWLTYKSNFGIDYYDRKTRTTLEREHPKAVSNHGYMMQSVSDICKYTFTNSLNVMTSFNDIHTLSGVVGFEMYDSRYSGFNQTGYDLDPFMKNSPAGIGDKNGSSNNPPQIGGGKTHNSLMSWFTQWNYTLMDRYNFSASLRYDNSSKFMGSNKHETFWSAGAAWDISREDFMKDIRWINQLKLRSSYGTTGNQDGISDFGAYNGYSKCSYNGVPGYCHMILGNPNLKWETSEQFNIGVDLHAWNDRFNVATDFYVKNTKNLLMDKKISQTSGFREIKTNAGSIRNLGVELSISGTPVRTANFEWNIGGNITFNKNKIVDLGSWANTDNKFVDGDFLYEVGKPLGTWYMVEWAGVNPDTGEAWFYDQKGGTTENIDAAPFVDKFKSAEVPIFGGFETNLSYKGISLSANFTYALNYYIMNATRWFIDNHKFNGNKPAYMLTMWREPGQITNVPRFDAKNNPSPWASQFLEDASYLRLKSVRLSWAPSAKLLKKLNIESSLQLFAQGENIFTVTNYSGMNPEVSGDTDYMSYPLPTSISFGATINF